jgi:hypothetical protein
VCSCFGANDMETSLFLTLSEPLQTRIRAVSREFNSSSWSPNREGNDGLRRRFHLRRALPGVSGNDFMSGKDDAVPDVA